MPAHEIDNNNDISTAHAILDEIVKDQASHQRDHLLSELGEQHEEIAVRIVSDERLLARLRIIKNYYFEKLAAKYLSVIKLVILNLNLLNQFTVEELVRLRFKYQAHADITAILDQNEDVQKSLSAYAELLPYMSKSKDSPWRKIDLDRFWHLFTTAVVYTPVDLIEMGKNEWCIADFIIKGVLNNKEEFKNIHAYDLYQLGNCHEVIAMEFIRNEALWSRFKDSKVGYYVYDLAAKYISVYEMIDISPSGNLLDRSQRLRLRFRYAGRPESVKYSIYNKDIDKEILNTFESYDTLLPYLNSTLKALPPIQDTQFFWELFDAGGFSVCDLLTMGENHQSIAEIILAEMMLKESTRLKNDAYTITPLRLYQIGMKHEDIAIKVIETEELRKWLCDENDTRNYLYELIEKRPKVRAKVLQDNQEVLNQFTTNQKINLFNNEDNQELAAGIILRNIFNPGYEDPIFLGQLLQFGCEYKSIAEEIFKNKKLLEILTVKYLRELYELLNTHSIDISTLELALSETIKEGYLAYQKLVPYMDMGKKFSLPPIDSKEFWKLFSTAAVFTEYDLYWMANNEVSIAHALLDKMQSEPNFEFRGKYLCDIIFNWRHTPAGLKIAERFFSDKTLCDRLVDCDKDGMRRTYQYMFELGKKHPEICKAIIANIPFCQTLPGELLFSFSISCDIKTFRSIPLVLFEAMQEFILLANPDPSKSQTEPYNEGEIYYQFALMYARQQTQTSHLIDLQFECYYRAARLDHQEALHEFTRMISIVQAERGEQQLRMDLVKIRRDHLQTQINNMLRSMLRSKSGNSPAVNTLLNIDTDLVIMLQIAEIYSYSNDINDQSRSRTWIDCLKLSSAKERILNLVDYISNCFSEVKNNEKDLARVNFYLQALDNIRESYPEENYPYVYRTLAKSFEREGGDRSNIIEFLNEIPVEDRNADDLIMLGDCTLAQVSAQQENEPNALTSSQRIAARYCAALPYYLGAAIDKKSERARGVVERMLKELFELKLTEEELICFVAEDIKIIKHLSFLLTIDEVKAKISDRFIWTACQKHAELLKIDGIAAALTKHITNPVMLHEITMLAVKQNDYKPTKEVYVLLKQWAEAGDALANSLMQANENINSLPESCKLIREDLKIAMSSVHLDKSQLDLLIHKAEELHATVSYLRRVSDNINSLPDSYKLICEDLKTVISSDNLNTNQVDLLLQKSNELHTIARQHNEQQNGLANFLAELNALTAKLNADDQVQSRAVNELVSRMQKKIAEVTANYYQQDFSNSEVKLDDDAIKKTFIQDVSHYLDEPNLILREHAHWLIQLKFYLISLLRKIFPESQVLSKWMANVSASFKIASTSKAQEGIVASAEKLFVRYAQ